MKEQSNNNDEFYKITILELIFSMVCKIIIIIFGIAVLKEEKEDLKKWAPFITLITIYMLIRDILIIVKWN